MECQRELAAYSLPAHTLSWLLTRLTGPPSQYSCGVTQELHSHTFLLGFFSFSTLCGQGVYVYIPQVDPIPNEDSWLISTRKMPGETGVV